jgi:hypothetical protein
VKAQSVDTARRMRVACIHLFNVGDTPVFGETTGKPSDPAPIYDAMVAERATGRDSRGRFVAGRAS